MQAVLISILQFVTFCDVTSLPLFPPPEDESSSVLHAASDTVTKPTAKNAISAEKNLVNFFIRIPLVFLFSTILAVRIMKESE